MSGFAEILTSLRKGRHLTQSELADSLGISKSAVSMYEQGKRLPSFDVIAEMADYFSVDMSYLLGHRDVVESITGTPEDDDAMISAKITAEELTIIKAYRLSSDELRHACMRLLRIE